jgi:hypothetical protein
MMNGYRFIAPEFAALINSINCTAYAMRCEGRSDVEQRNVIATGNTAGTTADETVLDVTTESQVCDAKMFVLPFVKLLTPVTPDTASQFFTARFNFSIDGEDVIDDSAIENHLLCPACLIAAQPTTSTLLLLGSPEVALLGTCQMFFLPNGTRIVATINDLPQGLGDLIVNAGSILVNYTTKVRQGCLFSVGALDAAQQAYPVQYPCNPSFGASNVGETSMAGSSPTAGPTAGPAGN